jgi:hypothetical protein
MDRYTLLWIVLIVANYFSFVEASEEEKYIFTGEFSEIWAEPNKPEKGVFEIRAGDELQFLGDVKVFEGETFFKFKITKIYPYSFLSELEIRERLNQEGYLHELYVKLNLFPKNESDEAVININPDDIVFGSSVYYVEKDKLSFKKIQHGNNDAVIDGVLFEGDIVIGTANQALYGISNRNINLNSFRHFYVLYNKSGFTGENTKNDGVFISLQDIEKGLRVVTKGHIAPYNKPKRNDIFLVIREGDFVVSLELDSVQRNVLYPDYKVEVGDVLEYVGERIKVESVSSTLITFKLVEEGKKNPGNITKAAIVGVPENRISDICSRSLILLK